MDKMTRMAFMLIEKPKSTLIGVSLNYYLIDDEE